MLYQSMKFLFILSFSNERLYGMGSSKRFHSLRITSIGISDAFLLTLRGLFRASSLYGGNSSLEKNNIINDKNIKKIVI